VKILLYSDNNEDNYSI